LNRARVFLARPQPRLWASSAAGLTISPCPRSPSCALPPSPLHTEHHRSKHSEDLPTTSSAPPTCLRRLTPLRPQLVHTPLHRWPPSRDYYNGFVLRQVQAWHGQYCCVPSCLCRVTMADFQCDTDSCKPSIQRRDREERPQCAAAHTPREAPCRRRSYTRGWERQILWFRECECSRT
jgi:hypothetical protein